MKSSPTHIEPLIRTLRGQRVILDSDLAAIYEVTTGRFNEAVKRNLARFPDDFAFILTQEEANSLLSQNAIAKTGRGGRTTPPRVFTEHGAMMAAMLLKSDRAITMSLYVVRAFIQMREQIAANDSVLKRLAEIDKTLFAHDDALRALWGQLEPLLMPVKEERKSRIGFHGEV